MSYSLNIAGVANQIDIVGRENEHIDVTFFKLGEIIR